MADTEDQRAVARRLLRAPSAPVAPTPAIRKGAAPSRPTSIRVRGGSAPPATTVASTVTKYANEGWQTLSMPSTAMMDIIATRGDRIHFVKIVPDESKLSTGWKNQFIQNALSNAAEPIFADDAGGLSNINDNRRVVIARRGSSAAASAASPQ